MQDGWTPLHLAVLHNRIDILDLLLWDARVDPAIVRNCPCHFCACSQYSSLSKSMQRLVDGRTALDVALDTHNATAAAKISSHPTFALTTVRRTQQLASRHSDGAVLDVLMAHPTHILNLVGYSARCSSPRPYPLHIIFCGALFFSLLRLICTVLLRRGKWIASS